MININKNMKRRDHIIMISLFIIVTVIFLVSEYNEKNITGNVIVDDLTLVNCKEDNNWRVCDIQYPNEIREEAYKEKITSLDS